jgi:hypothetical protein
VRVALTIPDGWSVTEDDEGGAASGPDAKLTWGGLGLVPHEPARVLADLAGAGLAAGGRIVPLSHEERLTADGWPFTLDVSEVLDASGARLAWRAYALYRFFEHAAVARISAPAPTPALLELLASARPDFSSAVASLAQLFDL